MMGGEYEKSPEVVAATSRALQVANLDGQQPALTIPGGPVKPFLIVRRGDDCVTVRGREAQTLALLVSKGPQGLTSGEASPYGWARRTSAYIYNLREDGFEIVTEREQVGDASVGRYILTSAVEIVEGGGL